MKIEIEKYNACSPEITKELKERYYSLYHKQNITKDKGLALELK
jgi:hypothetical protein